MNNIFSLKKKYFPGKKGKKGGFPPPPPPPPPPQSQKKKTIALTLGRVKHARNTDTVCLFYKGKLAALNKFKS